MLKDEEKVSPNRTQKGRIRSRRAILELLLENMAFSRLLKNFYG